MKGEELLGKVMKKSEKKEEEEYEMPKSEAISEHKRLVKVLRTGDKKALLKEAERQEKELQKIIKGEE
jgi:hypothetical protein